jgi:hypothetical protein
VLWSGSFIAAHLVLCAAWKDYRLAFGAPLPGGLIDASIAVLDVNQMESLHCGSGERRKFRMRFHNARVRINFRAFSTAGLPLACENLL